MRIVMVRGTLAACDSRLGKTRKSLEKAGHSIHVLDWNFGGQSVPASDPSTTHFNLKVKRGSAQLLLALPLWWAWIAWQLLRRRFDAVHACDLDTLPPAYAVARLKNKGIVHDVFDYYPDMLAGQVPRFVTGIMRAFYRFLLRRVDAVIIADQARALQVAPREPEAVIMNTPEDAYAVPVRTTRVKDKRSRMRVFYAGSLIRDRGIFTLLEAAAADKGVEVHIAGYGRDEVEVKRACEALENATFLGRIPYEEVLARSRDADVLFAFYDPRSPNNRLASPNKLFEAMMLARPLVTNEGTLAATRVKEIGMGIVVPFNHVHALRAAFRGLAQHGALRRRMGEAGRRAYEEEYNWSVMEHRLTRLYRGVQRTVRARGTERPGTMPMALRP